MDGSDPHPRASDSVGLVSPTVCISGKFPEDTDAAGPGSTFWASLVNRLVWKTKDELWQNKEKQDLNYDFLL